MMISVCVGQKKRRSMCKCYDIMRKRWLRTWDVLEEKERTMDVITSVCLAAGSSA